MDWNYLKKILKLFLGVLLVIVGLGCMILSIAGNFEITLTFLAFVVLAMGIWFALSGYHTLTGED